MLEATGGEQLLKISDMLLRFSRKCHINFFVVVVVVVVVIDDGSGEGDVDDVINVCLWQL